MSHIRLLIFIILTLFSTCLNANAFIVPSTDRGTFSFLMNDMTVQGSPYQTLLVTGDGSHIDYWYDPGWHMNMVIEVSGLLYAWFAGPTQGGDNIQDLVTIVFPGDGGMTRVYVNEKQLDIMYWNGRSPSSNLGGDVFLGDYAIAGSGRFSSEVLSQQGVSDRFQTYKRFGNYGDTIIDKFFNQVFSLMSGQ